MAIRLDPADEYMHELGPESNFNESMYINCFDPVNNVGGWFRMGNRANEGTAEMTVACISLMVLWASCLSAQPLRITINSTLVD